MFDHVRSSLRRVERQSRPDRHFRVRLRNRLVYPYGRPWYVFAMKPVAGVMSIAVMMGAGTGVYAYSSEQVLPSHPLYPVRQEMEALEEHFQFTDVQRANLRRKLLSRRVHEAELMDAGNRKMAPQDISRITNAVRMAVEVGSTLPPELQRQHDQMIVHMELRQAKLIQRGSVFRKQGEREAVERAFTEHLEQIGEYVEHLGEGRKQEYQNLLIRRAAVMKKLHWRLENGDVYIVPDIKEMLPFAPTSVDDLEQRIREVDVLPPALLPTQDVSDDIQRVEIEAGDAVEVMPIRIEPSEPILERPLFEITR